MFAVYPQATKTLVNSNGVYTITPNQYVLAADTFYFAAIGDTANTLLGKTRASQIYATKASVALKLAISDTASVVLGKTRASQIYETKANVTSKTDTASLLGSKTFIAGKYATLANNALKLNKTDTTSFAHVSQIKSQYIHEFGYMTAIVTTATVGETNTVLVFTDCTPTVLGYFTQAGDVCKMKLVGKSWLYDGGDDYIVISDDDVTVTIPNSEITGAGVPANGDSFVIAYIGLTVTHSLNSLFTTNNLFYEKTYGGGYNHSLELFLQDGNTTFTANSFTTAPTSTAWKIKVVITKID